MGVLFISAVVLKASLGAHEQKEGTPMMQLGLRNWTKKAFLACAETIWALVVGFVAGVLAA